MSVRLLLLVGMLLSAALTAVSEGTDLRSGPGRLSFVLSPKGCRTGPDFPEFPGNCTRPQSSLEVSMPVTPPAAPILVLRVFGHHTADLRIAEPQQVVVKKMGIIYLTTRSRERIENTWRQNSL
jgi:hypothetical protein